MALLEAIGPYYFLDLRDPTQLPQQQTELLSRPGVPGVGQKLNGIRGKPFKLHSRVDCKNIADAEQTYGNYTALIGTGPVGLIHHNVVYSEFGVAFLVLDVERVLQKMMLFFSGGLNPPSLAWLEARWTLCAVLLDQEAGTE